MWFGLFVVAVMNIAIPIAGAAPPKNGADSASLVTVPRGLSFNTYALTLDYPVRMFPANPSTLGEWIPMSTVYPDQTYILHNCPILYSPARAVYRLLSNGVEDPDKEYNANIEINDQLSDNNKEALKAGSQAVVDVSDNGILVGYVLQPDDDAAASSAPLHIPGWRTVSGSWNALPTNDQGNAVPQVISRDGAMVIGRSIGNSRSLGNPVSINTAEYRYTGNVVESTSGHLVIWQYDQRSKEYKLTQSSLPNGYLGGYSNDLKTVVVNVVTKISDRNTMSSYVGVWNEAMDDYNVKKISEAETYAFFVSSDGQLITYATNTSGGLVTIADNQLHPVKSTSQVNAGLGSMVFFAPQKGVYPPAQMPYTLYPTDKPFSGILTGYRSSGGPNGAGNAFVGQPENNRYITLAEFLVTNQLQTGDEHIDVNIIRTPNTVWITGLLRMDAMHYTDDGQAVIAFGTIPTDQTFFNFPIQYQFPATALMGTHLPPKKAKPVALMPKVSPYAPSEIIGGMTGLKLVQGCEKTGLCVIRNVRRRVESVLKKHCCCCMSGETNDQTPYYLSISTKGKVE